MTLAVSASSAAEIGSDGSMSSVASPSHSSVVHVRVVLATFSVIVSRPAEVSTSSQKTPLSPPRKDATAADPGSQIFSASAAPLPLPPQ